MPVRFTQGEIAFLLTKLAMSRLRKGGALYAGLGPDGRFRICTFHYHSDQTQVAVGTARAVATALGFATVEEMKDYLRNKGWKK